MKSPKGPSDSSTDADEAATVRHTAAASDATTACLGPCILGSTVRHACHGCMLERVCALALCSQAGQPSPGGISAGFTALCSSYQQLAGTGIGPNVLEAAATPNASQVGGEPVCQLGAC